MATHFEGPLDVYGPQNSTSNTPGNYPEFGPSTIYGGVAIRDPRFGYMNGITGLGKTPGFLVGSSVKSADCAPPTAAAAGIVAAATGTSATAMTLVTTSGNGMFVNLPMVPFGSAIKAANVVRVTAIGPGTTIGTTTATSGAVASVGDTRSIVPGAWVCIPEAGGTGIPHIAQVTARTASTLTITPVAVASVSGAAIFLMDDTGTTVSVMQTAGAARVMDPYSSLSRGLSVTSNNAADTGWTMNLACYDVYRVPVTIALALTANAATYTTKTVKFIASATPTNTGSTTGTLSVGTSDVFGFHWRLDNWEDAKVFWNAALITAATGITTAVTTSPATGATGDVRGTVQVSAVGPLGSGVSANAANGTRRLVMSQRLTNRNLTPATPTDYSAMFGVTQV